MLDETYHEMLRRLYAQREIEHAEWRHYAGIRFLYVRSPLPSNQLGRKLEETGFQITAGTKLQWESVYVRSEGHQHIFRFRLLVPNEKQFCCGNLCEDCFLLRGLEE